MVLEFFNVLFHNKYGPDEVLLRLDYITRNTSLATRVCLKLLFSFCLFIVDIFSLPSIRSNIDYYINLYVI